jgi:hypothetical protein
MVVTLETYFVNRARVLEMKDGNPLNEADFIRLSTAFFADIERKYL